MSAGTRPDESTERRDALIRRVRLLVGFAITYNVVEAVVALIAGSAAGSAALLGFGLDSAVEVSSAAAVAWQFAGRDHEVREKTALRLIALWFFGLATFVTVEAVGALVAGHAPEHSGLGIAIAALSLLIMPIVSSTQRRAGHALGSHSAVADSKQTLLCTYMSAALLIGLLAKSLLGWWWADASAALLIAGLAVKEGLNAWSGDVCCSPTEVFFDHGEHDDGCHDEDGCCGCETIRS
ncbi:MAG TPA: cation transporter [Aeromicrobium sp.]|nr:cation transporter [Aeromicrobium sp.]